MDLGRSCYSTDMQFDQAGQIIRKVTWYFAEPGASYFPNPHLWGSDNWTPSGYVFLGPGERWDSLRPWSNGAAPFFAPGTGSFCGMPGWFTDGAPSDAPPIQYSGVGVPVCCPQPTCQPLNPRLSGRLVTQVNSTPEVWPLLINSGGTVQADSPDVPGLFFRVNSTPFKRCGTEPAVEAFLSKTSSPPFDANAEMVAYVASSNTATYAFPTAPSPYDQVVIAFQSSV